MPPKTQQPSGRGCLITLAVILVFIIGAIANACSGSSAPVSQPAGTGPIAATSTAPLAPAAAPSPAHARHHHHKRHHHHHAYVSSPTTAPAPPPGCHPLSNEGTCYEPGEFCRDSDHGVTGRAGNGETIICEDNDGWRWEPA